MTKTNETRNDMLIGGVLIILGLFFLLKNYLGWEISWDFIWPLILVGLGIAILIRANS